MTLKKVFRVWVGIIKAKNCGNDRDGFRFDLEVEEPSWGRF